MYKTGIAAIATTGLSGVATTIATNLDTVGGVLIGVSAAAVGIFPLARRLLVATAQMEASRTQYEAAQATLGPQRARMLADYEGRLAEHVARLNAKHETEVFDTQCQWYERGATDALLGRLHGPAEQPRASVVPLRSRGRRPLRGPL